MEENKEIVVRDEVPSEVPSIQGDAPEKSIVRPTVQSRMEELIPFAGTIEATEEQRKILFAPVDPESVEIRPDGLVYLPWMAYVERLRDAFGVGWALIPRDMPKTKDNHMLWAFYLMIQGKLAGFAIGEQEVTSGSMTYSDCTEGCKSNALMRLCKGIGISLELWKPSFIREWKKKHAETFPATWPDGKPKLDKNGKQKVEWRRKGAKIEEAQVVGEVYCSTGEPTPSTSSIPIITSTIDNVTKRDGKKGNTPFTIYTLHIGENKITTFSETLAKTAKEFMTKKESAVIEYKVTKYGMELMSITPVEVKTELEVEK